MTAAPRTLDDWQRYAESVHPVGIDMGLERIGVVADRLGFDGPDRRPAPRSVIVAGTNGKGSTCMALEALLTASGLRVGTTLSPHLHRFNERVRIDAAEADDPTLCEAFAAVDAARGEIPLTYFEFSALVALTCFRAAAVDVAVLEVGLGGRLDAFNLVSADVAVITSIGLDHQAYLGDDLDGIGREKAGVLRQGRPAVLGREVTASVTQAAAALGCPLRRLGEDFDVVERQADWDLLGTLSVTGIRRGDLPPHNCALAVEAAAFLAEPTSAAVRGLADVRLPGRFETWRLAGGLGPMLVLDVAHNPAGATFLREQLALRLPEQHFVAVSGMLEDKDSAGVAAAIGDIVRRWVCVSTLGSRGLSGDALAARIDRADAVDATADAAEGLQRALSLCAPGDGILAFGSFNLVERMRDLLRDGFAGAVPVGADHSLIGPDKVAMDVQR